MIVGVLSLKDVIDFSTPEFLKLKFAPREFAILLLALQIVSYYTAKEKMSFGQSFAQLKTETLKFLFSIQNF